MPNLRQHRIIKQIINYINKVITNQQQIIKKKTFTEFEFFLIYFIEFFESVSPARGPITYGVAGDGHEPRRPPLLALGVRPASLRRAEITGVSSVLFRLSSRTLLSKSNDVTTHDGSAADGDGNRGSLRTPAINRTAPSISLTANTAHFFFITSNSSEQTKSAAFHFLIFIFFPVFSPVPPKRCPVTNTPPCCRLKSKRHRFILK